MSETYICRCGERKEPCYSCVNQTCNTLRSENKDLERQLSQQESDYNDILIALKEEHKKELEVYKSIAEQAIGVSPDYFDENLGWSESIKKLKEKGE